LEGNNPNNNNNCNFLQIPIKKITSDSNKKLKFSFLDKLILLKIAPRFSRARKKKS
jgi:hypothetical protein